MAPTEAEFRHALGHYATGVTVVTIRDDEGRPYGLTVNSFTSVSLDPLLVLVCIDHTAHGYPYFSRGKHFGVNILSESQEDLSRRFADRRISDRFENLPWVEGATGVPLLPDSLAWLECRITEAYAGGDHTIFLGGVEEVRVAGGYPLIFYRGRYGPAGLTVSGS